METQTSVRQANQELKHYLEGFATLMDRSSSKAKVNGYHYKSLYHFATQEFKYYESAQLTKEEKVVVMRAIKNLGFKPQVKQCFYNSQMLAMSDTTDTIKYVEGYAKNFIPTLHGWCEINGKVIDLTWKEDGQYVIGEFKEDTAYAGVTFPAEYFSAIMLKTRYATTLIEDYERDFPVMKHKWDSGKSLMGMLKTFKNKKR